MKRNSFLEGTIIATICIVIVKILGMIYVIPFYATVGVSGAALYAYAYNIYSLFLDISTAGIPTAVSKIINEYNTLGYQEAKARAFRIGKKILGFIASIAFIILFVFAPSIAKLIIGDMTGGNTIEDVTLVLRCVSFALLVFPFLSATRGFFQGHNVISVSSFSQIIEQFIRVLIIVCGSFIVMKLLGEGATTYAVCVAVFGAFFGGVGAYIYVRNKLKKNKEEFSLKENFEEKDKITNKEIIKKIIYYAVPLVIVSIASAIYNNVDMVLILRTLNQIGFPAQETEFIATGLSTWAGKISIIITSVGLGMVASLVPHMVESYTLKKYDEVNIKFNQAMKMIAFISIPMTVGICLLSAPIWSIFYGYSKTGTIILTFCIFTPLLSNFLSITSYTMQSMNRFKMVYVSTIVGFILNAILDIPFMLLFDFLGIPAYLGAVIATYISIMFSIIISIFYLKKKYNFQFASILKTLRNMVLPLGTMIIVVILMRLFIPANYESRISCLLYIAIISLVGAISYFIVSYKMGLIDDVLGKNFFVKIKNKLKRNKKEV